MVQIPALFGMEAKGLMVRSIQYVNPTQFSDDAYFVVLAFPLQLYYHVSTLHLDNKMMPNIRNLKWTHHYKYLV